MDGYVYQGQTIQLDRSNLEKEINPTRQSSVQEGAQYHLVPHVGTTDIELSQDQSPVQNQSVLTFVTETWSLTMELIGKLKETQTRVWCLSKRFNRK